MLIEYLLILRNNLLILKKDLFLSRNALFVHFGLPYGCLSFIVDMCMQTSPCNELWLVALLYVSQYNYVATPIIPWVTRIDLGT